MPDDSLSIRVDPTPPRRRVGKLPGPRSRRHVLVAAGIAACLLVCVGAALWIGSGRGDESTLHEGGPAIDQAPQATSKPHTRALPDASPPGEEIVADDGQLLWASPTAGAPIALDWIPDGTQVVVHLRPRELVAHPEWEKIVDGLEPWGREALAWLRRVTGCDLNELETLLLAETELPDGSIDFVIRATLTTSWDAAELARRFPGGESPPGPHPQRQHAGRVYLLPHDSAGPALVIYPASLVDRLPSSPVEAPALVRDVERLLGASDAQRSITLVLVPRFLEAGGSQLLADQGRPLRRVIQWLLGDDATAAALAVHLDDNLFIELTATPTSSTPPRRLALNLSNKILAAADRVEDLLLASDRPAYGQKILIRFPSMLRQLARYTRFAAEQQWSVVRCYLPAIAGHNLATASQLLITLPSGKRVEAAAPAVPRTIEERLAQSTSLVFTKETLENCLAQLSAAIDTPIEIAGSDLQLLGITKNQSLAINLRDQPAEEILAEILRQANPDQATESLADPRQQLVYLISRDGISGNEGGQGRIIVTTRTAATQRGERLPEVFVQPGE